MERSRTALADAVDTLVAAGRGTVTETAERLALYQLDASGARMLVPLLAPAGFVLDRVADEGGPLDPAAIDDGAEAIELVAVKPAVPAGIMPVLTAAGFERHLDRPEDARVVWVQGLSRVVDTVTTSYRPWGDDAPFARAEPPADPARVVRRLDGTSSDPIGRWLLRDPDADVTGRPFGRWRRRAAEALAEALAQEVEPGGTLMFRGPPTTRFRGEGARKVDVGSLASLQRAAGWVYDNPRELENRHGLLAAEVARTSLRDGDIADLAAAMGGALEGARIAYGFGLSQQSREALSSLSDLRKAVSDETGRLSDATRTIAAAVTTSAVGNVGLVIARLTVAKDSTFVASAAVVIGLALAVYVGAVIASGAQYLSIQSDLREDWRDRLYRFLSEDEYRRMVTDPIKRAECGFLIAAWCSGAVAGLLLFAVALVVLLTRVP